MKPTQRLIYSVILLLLAILMLSACGNSASQTNESMPNGAQQTEENSQNTPDEGNLDQPEEPADDEGEIEVEAEMQLVELRQWATSATASSEYSADINGAIQATGKPDTETCGDRQTAWSPWDEDTVETIELGYQTPVYATQVNIYQTYSPDQVVLVEVLDADSDEFQTVYESEPVMIAEDECPYTLEVQIDPATETLVTGVRITIDQSNPDRSWNHIDAVELVGIFYSTEQPETASADPEEREVIDLGGLNPNYEMPVKVIEPGNASQVTELWASGNGIWVDEAWSDNSLYAGVATSLGVYVFDAVSGEPLIFKKHTGIQGIAFSHDNQILAVGTWTEITLYALSDGAELNVIAPDLEAKAVAFHQDTGNLVVVGESIISPGKVIFQYYDPQSGSLEMEEEADTSLIDLFVINKLAADGKHLLRTLSGSDTAEIFDTTGAKVFSGSIPGIGPSAELYDVLVGEYLISDSDPGQFQVYRVDGSQVGTLPKPAGWEFGVGLISQNAEFVYIYDAVPYQLYQYSLPSLELLETSEFCGNNVRSFSPDMTRSMRRTGWELNNTNVCELVVKLDLNTTPQGIALNPVKPQIVSLGFSTNPDYYGQVIFTAWDLTTGEIEKIVTFTEDFDPLRIRGMQFLQDGKTLVLYAYAPVSELIFYDLELEQITDRLPLQSFAFYYAVSPDMNTAAVAFLDPVAMVELWDLNSKELLGMQLLPGDDQRILGVQFSPDSSSLFVMGTKNFRWDLDALEPPEVFEGLSAVAVSSDLAKAAGVVRGTLVITDLETMEPLGAYSEWLEPGQQFTGLMLFSHDNRLLIAGTSTGILLVDVTSGEVLQILNHRLLNDLQVSPDGDYFLTYSSFEAKFRLWGVP